MRITYLTTDEVNRELSARAAIREGLELAIRPAGSGMGGSSSDAIIYDLDQLALEDREALVADLCAGSSTGLVAVLSYNLEDDDVATLKSRGVLVFRRFEPALLGRIAREAASRETTTAINCEYDVDGCDPTVLGGLVRSLACSAYRLLHQAGDEKTETFEAEVAEVAVQVKELLCRLARINGSSLRELRHWAASLERLFEENFASVESAC